MTWESQRIGSSGLSSASRGRVNVIIPEGDGLLAVGWLEGTDPGRDAIEKPGDFETPKPWSPIDIAIWRSSDGADWQPATPSDLLGIPDAQLPIDAVVVGDRILLSGSATEDDSLVSAVWMIDTDGSVTTSTAIMSGAPTAVDWFGGGLEIVDGVAVVVGDWVVGNRAVPGIAVYDPATGEFGGRNLGRETDVEQLESAVVIDGRLYAFGRQERRVDSDLQVVRISLSAS